MTNLLSRKRRERTSSLGFICIFASMACTELSVFAQCIEGVPAAYPLGEQVSLHILDPDCSFEAKWKKHIADPSVDSVGLVYHERITVPAMELMKANPSNGQTLTVWALDGESSTKATTTTATDIGGDYSAYVLTVQAPSCNSARIGSMVTTPDKTEVAGFVRKAIDGPQCILHVIKPSSIRSLLSVQVPVGAPLVTLNGLGETLVPRKIWNVDTAAAISEPDLNAGPSAGVSGSDVSLVIILKKGTLGASFDEAAGDLFAADIEREWADRKPRLRYLGTRYSDSGDWRKTSAPLGAGNQVLILMEMGWTRGYYTLAVRQNNGDIASCSKTIKDKKRSMTRNDNFRIEATEIVSRLSSASCLGANDEGKIP